MCSRTFCPDCGGEFIHRDHRRHWESASTLGQIIHHLKRSFTYVDIDGCTYKRTKRLLRLVEHKQPHQMVKYAQGEVLELLDRIIAHYVECPTAQDVEKLHPDSGVYLMTGELDAADEGHRECHLPAPRSSPTSGSATSPSPTRPHSTNGSRAGCRPSGSRERVTATDDRAARLASARRWLERHPPAGNTDVDALLVRQLAGYARRLTDALGHRARARRRVGRVERHRVVSDPRRRRLRGRRPPLGRVRHRRRRSARRRAHRRFPLGPGAGGPRRGRPRPNIRRFEEGA